MPERLVERPRAGSHAQGRDTKTMSGSSMIGIDVASAHVDVVAIGGEPSAALSHVVNDAEGHGLARLMPALVLMEVTGG